MRYQFIKHNKTSSRVLGIFATMEEVKKAVALKKLRYAGRSYIGGFPTFTDDQRKTYSVQGMADGFNIVCSLPERDAEAFA